MGWFSKLFSASATEPIKAVGNVLDDLFTSDEEELTLEIVKQRLAMKPMMVQAETNKIAATHRSRFVAGARPYILWVCGTGLAMAFILNPIIEIIWDVTLDVPLDAMMELTLAMLGLATLRTVEKMNGVSK